MRTSLGCVFACVVLLAAAVPAVADVNPALIQQAGSKWYVTPAGDGNVDGDNLNFVVAHARPGDTVLLKAGTFVLTKAGPHSYRVVLPVPGEPHFDLNINFQVVMVDRKLTFMGERGPDGTLLTTITNRLNPAYGHFDVSAVGVTFRHLRFYEMSLGVHMFVAGTSVENCHFENSGQYQVFYPTMDVRTVYPHYVPTGGNPAEDPAHEYDFSDPVRTYFTNNTLVNCRWGVWGYGSEIVMTGNKMECRNTAVYLTPGWGMARQQQWRNVLEAGVAQGNLFRGNTVSGQTTHTVNVCFAAYWTGILRSNEVSQNVFTDVFHGVEFYAYSEFGPSIVKDNVVTYNRFESEKGCTLVGSYWPTHENLLVANNLFQEAGSWAVNFWATRDSAILGNKMDNLTLPGLDPDEAHIYLDQCERTTVLGPLKNLVIVDINGIDNVIGSTVKKQGVAKPGGKVCMPLSEP